MSGLEKSDAVGASATGCFIGRFKGSGLILSLLMTLFSTGCVYAYQRINDPINVQMRLVTKTPDKYRILILGETMHEPKIIPEGIVSFTIPPLLSGSRVFFLGIVEVANHGPTSRRAVYVFKEDKVIKTLTIKEVEALPVDEAGYRILRL